MRLGAAILFAVVALAPAGRAQTPQDVMHSFAARQFILFHTSGGDKIKVRKGSPQKASGHCDIAVEVYGAKWDDGKGSLQLENIGTPHLASGASRSCQIMASNITLELSGFAPDEPAASLSGALREVIKTPEEYMAANGMAFDYPPAPQKEEAAKPPPPLIHPQVLLTVDGTYSQAARERRIDGAVVVQILVGSDGRIHRSRIVRGLEKGLDENALRVLPIWRFKPGEQDDRPVASSARIEMNFHII